MALFACALLLASCAGPGSKKRDKTDVEERLQHYSGLLLSMDSAGIAAMFATDGEMVNPTQPPLHGRAAIEKFLSGYSGYHVLSNVDEPSSTLIDGDTAEQLGTYRERVRTPDGQFFEGLGRFEIEWVRSASGEWLILQLATFPSK